MRYFFATTLYLIAIAAFISCKDECEDFDPPAKRGIEFGFETELEDWIILGGGGERHQESDIVISSDYFIEGEKSCKFTVSPESYLNGGSRAELVFDQYAYEGDETWYEWSFFIPDDYPNVPLKASDGSPNWQILGQWHQQPVLCKGEDWTNYTGEGESPPVSLNYDFILATDPAFQEIVDDENYNSVHGFNPNWNNTSIITVAVMNKPVAFATIQKGEWVRMKFHVLWSQTNEGFVEVWKNDTLITDGKYFGCNMLNMESHYFKFGLYRNYRIYNTQTVYVDDVKVW
jgi:hypothetical protein